MKDLAPGDVDITAQDDGILFRARMAEGRKLTAELALQLGTLATEFMAQVYADHGCPLTFTRQDMSWVDDGDDTITVRFTFPFARSTP